MAQSFRENIYSDNHIGGEDDEQMAVLHYRESKKLCRGASMNLREFYTNSRLLREQIEPADVGKSLHTKVLGVSWDLEKDTFGCGPLKGEFSNVGPFTKRVVVRDVAKIFDPCGWLSPVVLPGKLLIQDLWKQKLEWDTPLSREVVSTWVKIRENLAKIPTVEIPRYVGSIQQSHQLHAFCDASLKASAAAVYLRTMIDGQIQGNLLMAKTRLAPLSPQQTIPRLELISVELGVHLIDFTAEHLKSRTVEKFVWSDSQCVLSWIKNEKLTTKFVKNRVENIRAVIGIEFRFVSGLENPADIPSRGTTFDKLAENEVWWHGPSWLKEPESAWPPNILKYEQKVEAVATETVSNVVAVVGDAPEPIIDFSRPCYKTHANVVRVVAWTRRRLGGLTPRASRHVGPLSIPEITLARKSCDKMVQNEVYGNFDHWQRVPKAMPESLRPLNVYRDHESLLRCRSRIQNADLPFDAQHPILLPKNHPYTRLVIAAAHTACGHAGAAQTLTSVRQTYWIVHGKSAVKSVVQNCYRCRRTEGGPYRAPEVPPLPDFRVDASIPFEFVGIDNLGPLLIRTGENKEVKVWITLFTCAVTRAIHLEVVADQSAQEFHLALRRFIATYGSPKLIVSDNAAQYRIVDEVLKKLTPAEISQELARKFCLEWKYIPEVGPWFGGFYERMIGLVKRFLKKALDGILARMTELQTIVAEITFIVNSRPLLAVDVDNSFCGLCPNDFLGKPRQSCFPTFEDTPIDLRPYQTKGRLLERWKQLQRLSDQFWQLFRQAYLTSLREKYSNALPRGTSSLTPTVGSVVQIKEEKQPRGKWRLGVIQSLIPSNDGRVRSVILRLSDRRQLIRPVKLLYPLEMAIPEPAQNDESDFEGFTRDDVARAQDLLRGVPDTPCSAGGSASDS